MEKLVATQKPFKYLLNTMIMQRKGASVVIAQSNYWDTQLDSAFTVVWPKEKAGKAELSKNTIQCMVSVYAMTCLNGNSLIKNDIWSRGILVKIYGYDLCDFLYNFFVFCFRFEKITVLFYSCDWKILSELKMCCHDK